MIIRCIPVVASMLLLSLLPACGDSKNQGGASGGSTSNATLPKQITSKYAHRRNTFFGLKPVDVGMPGDPTLMGKVVLGVMVENGYGAKGVVSILAAADGSTSILTSTGSSDFVGFGGALRVAAASKDMIGGVAGAIDMMTPTGERGLPPDGMTFVYTVTANDVRLTKVSRAELKRGTHFLGPIVAQSNRVYAEVRAAHKAMQGGQ